MQIKPYRSTISELSYYKTTKTGGIHVSALPFWSEKERIWILNVEKLLSTKTDDSDMLFFSIVSGVSEWGVHLKNKYHKGRGNKWWRTKAGVGAKKIIKMFGSGIYGTGLMERKDFYTAIAELYGEKKERNMTGENTKEKREKLAKEKLFAKVQIAIEKMENLEMEDEDPMVDLILQKLCVEMVEEYDMKTKYMEILSPHICLSGTEYSIRPSGDNS